MNKKRKINENIKKKIPILIVTHAFPIEKLESKWFVLENIKKHVQYLMEIKKKDSLLKKIEEIKHEEITNEALAQYFCVFLDLYKKENREIRIKLEKKLFTKRWNHWIKSDKDCLLLIQQSNLHRYLGGYNKEKQLFRISFDKYTSASDDTPLVDGFYHISTSELKEWVWDLMVDYWDHIYEEFDFSIDNLPPQVKYHLDEAAAILKDTTKPIKRFSGNNNTKYKQRQISVDIEDMASMHAPPCIARILHQKTHPKNYDRLQLVTFMLQGGASLEDTKQLVLKLYQREKGENFSMRDLLSEYNDFEDLFNKIQNNQTGHWACSTKIDRGFCPIKQMDKSLVDTLIWMGMSDKVIGKMEDDMNTNQCCAAVYNDIVTDNPYLKKEIKHPLQWI